MSESNKSDKEGQSAIFKVTIDQMKDMTFKSCEGLESEVEVNSLFDGGSMAAPLTVRGHQRVNKISFSSGTILSGGGSKSSSISDWYKDVCDASKPLKKKAITIQMMDAREESKIKWRLKNAWPCRWVGPLLSKGQNDSSIEYITFAHEGIEEEK